MIKTPAIIISAYNREKSLIRLLDSLAKSSYQSNKIPLVISIDKSNNSNILTIAEKFNWEYGEKKIIHHSKKLGLKAHILFCLKKVEEYESIILLEDDLIVSKYFYNYSLQSLKYYYNETEIAGISLYNYNFTEALQDGGIYPFHAIDDDSDIYFMRVPSSWGLAINTNMWKIFNNWYQKHLEIDKADELPSFIKSWPKTSWKKHLFHYMIAENKYFIYPRLSHTSNFNDKGTSNTITNQIFQVPLALKDKKLNLKKLTNNSIIYDEYFEPTPETINHFVPLLKEYDYQLDLYGLKDLEIINEKFLLTARTSKKPILSWGKGMRPHVLNIINGIEGDTFSLSLKTDVAAKSFPPHHFHYNEASIAKYIFKKDDEWSLSTDLPLISIIAPIVTDDIVSIQNIINEFNKQTYNQKEIILINCLNNNLANSIKSDDNIIIIDKPDTKNQYEIINYGIKQARGEYIGMLSHGGNYQKNTLKNVDSIFRNLAMVSWIYGISKNQNEKSQTFRQSYRVINQLYSGIYSNNHLFNEIMYYENIFFKKWLWLDYEKNNHKNKNLISCWFNFIKKTDLYFVNQALGSSNKKINYSQKKYIFTRTKKKSFMKKILTLCFYPFIKFNIPLLRTIFIELNDYPLIIKYDSKTSSFFLSRS